jgi:hypothetical protein
MDVGAKVRKIKGDYTFEGVVVYTFVKFDRDLKYWTDQRRVVVQNADGVLHIFNLSQLEEMG